MIEITPAILARDEAEFRAKTAKIHVLGLPVHVDVMDGVFVPQTAWAPPERMRELLGDLVFDAHLMVADPEKAVTAWLEAGARTVIFHAEAVADCSAICHDAGESCADLSLALNPPTDAASVTAALDDIGHATIMGVTPGKSGQPFQEIALEKIRALKKAKPGLRILVDGGVKPENVRAIADAGADAVVAGSAITDQDDPAAALERFRAALAG